MDTDSFIVYVKTEDIYKYIAKDVEKRFDTSNFETDKPLPKEKNKKLDNELWIRRTNHERTSWINSKKTYSYLKENNDANKKAKGTKKWPVKWLRIIKTV